MLERLYNIIAINDKTGKKVFLTGYPMNHKKCLIMLSKLSDYPNRRFLLIEDNNV